MDSQRKESGSSSLFVRLIDFAEKRGISRSEANHVLRSMLKRLRQKSPQVSETLFYVAGVRTLSHFAQDSERLARLGSDCQVTGSQWARAAESIAGAMTPENREQAGKGVDALPADLQRIYKMLLLENKSYATIAQELNTSVESVRAQVFRAKEILRGRFGMLLMG